MNDANVKVSAMILAYNHERFIGQAIEGFLIQKTEFPCELVVIDDCSTDGTREVVRRYWEREPGRIRVLLNRHNIGARASIVRAYAACRGQYVAPTDGDDYWVCPEKLQRQADFLDAHPGCAMCFHSVTTVWDDGRQEPFVMRPPRIQETFTLADLLECNLAQACSPMYRKGLFGEHPAWVYLTPAMDWAHHLLHAQYGDIGYIDEPMGVYRQHGGGVYSNLSVADKLKIAIECLRRFRCVLDVAYHGTITRSLAAHYLELARTSHGDGNPGKARVFMRDCLVESLHAAKMVSPILFLRMFTATYFPGSYRRLRRLFCRDGERRSQTPRGCCQSGTRSPDVADNRQGGSISKQSDCPRAAS